MSQPAEQPVPPAAQPPLPPAPPPRRARTAAEHGDLARTVLFYALALGVVLVGVAALLIGIAWSDLADNAGRPGF
ncbi:hypothetical protein ACIPSE_27050 [Streptomyces sp. NPDC090106]|uniref:hypothetical protein n=1 Tax=Streptomyces sp. NPDC090106 TaxID=3365946 RepID=UPI0038228446